MLHVLDTQIKSQDFECPFSETDCLFFETDNVGNVVVFKESRDHYVPRGPS